MKELYNNKDNSWTVIYNLSNLGSYTILVYFHFFVQSRRAKLKNQNKKDMRYKYHYTYIS